MTGSPLMHDPAPTGRSRFSLRTLLLLIPMLAMGLAIWRSHAELSALRTEVRKLRDETGQLTIDDPEKIHAIQIATDYPLAWKWRVYIPQGRNVRVAHRNHLVAKAGVPETANGLSLAGPKEFVVTLKVDKQPDGQWRTGVSCDGQTTYLSFPENATTWLDQGESGSQWMLVDREVAKEQDGEPLVLLRKRVFYERGQIPPPSAPAETDGLLIWISAPADSARP